MSSFSDAKDGLKFCEYLNSDKMTRLLMNHCPLSGLVGPARVGKSAIVSALEERPFVEKYFSTIRVSTSVIVRPSLGICTSIYGHMVIYSVYLLYTLALHSLGKYLISVMEWFFRT